MAVGELGPGDVATGAPPSLPGSTAARSNGPIAGIAGAVSAVLLALIAALANFDLVHWTATQATLVGTEATTVVGLAAAVVAHVMPSTTKEPVAVAGAVTACAIATLELVNGFHWWVTTPDQNTSLIALVAALVGLGGALLARRRTSPLPPRPAAPDADPR